MKNLTGKIALITGGSRGLGKNMAEQLSDHGTDIILTYNSNQEAAHAVVKSIEEKGGKAVALQLNVGDTGSFSVFFEQVAAALQANWGRDTFDFLINNAGVGAHVPIAATEEETFDNLMNIHFKGTYFMVQRSIPLLAEGGRVINISTGLARFSLPGYAAYASMKGGVETFTRYVAAELGAKRITANIVAPGAIETDFTKPAFEAFPGMREQLAQSTALGRVGVPDDIGGVVAFLCSEEGRWVNGQRIEVTGGVFL